MKICFSPRLMKLAYFRKTALSLMIPMTIPLSAQADSGMVKNALLPTDAQQTCTVELKEWFQGGHVTANGEVNSPNSQDPLFANSEKNTVCDFFKWGAQMFLWVTNQADGDKRYLFNTGPTFYNISVEESNNRTFLEQTDGPMLFAVRVSKTDEEIELGQAGGNDVLLSQGESLVYYGVHANDVFAAYLTGQKSNAFSVKSTLNQAFPYTTKETQTVVQYAQKSLDIKIPQENARVMAVELKTSWVDASGWDDSTKSEYIVGSAEVPVFDRANNMEWNVNGTATKELALVGMHVVGTVEGHPEMVWATFEHVSNAPTLEYQYTTSESGGTSTQPYDSSSKAWVFMPKGGAQPAQIVSNAVAKVKDNSTETEAIVCVPTASTDASSSNCENPIGAVEVANMNPWGSLPSGDGNIDTNTALISLNSSVLGQLVAGDVRGNYVQTGSVWTMQGQIPNNGTDPNIVGSLYLANTTMETFFQYPAQKTADNPKGYQPKNCFGCHATSTPNKSMGISHVYGALQPLTPAGDKK